MSLHHDTKELYQEDGIPKASIAISAIIAIFSIYIVGYNQGKLFNYYKEVKHMTQCDSMNLLMI